MLIFGKILHNLEEVNFEKQKLKQNLKWNFHQKVENMKQKFMLKVQRALPWPPNKVSHLTVMCKYVNSTTHAMVCNLQQLLYELCKEG